jgi:hypothetical protein
VVYFKALSQCSPGEVEDTITKIPQDNPLSGAEIAICDLWSTKSIDIGSIMYMTAVTVKRE